MSRIKGHWFCDHCGDIVFMTYERTDQANVLCVVCGYFACNFVPQTLSRKMLPKEWFDAMRRVAAEAANPELPDMRHHKKLL